MVRPVTIEAACEKLLEALPGPAGDVESLALPLCLSRVTAVAVLAPTDLPAFDRSLVDGYAVWCGCPERVRLAGEVTMGRAADPLPGRDCAVAVPTGGMLPPGADAVVMQEDVTVVGGWVHIGRTPVPEQNIVRRGADARGGVVVVPAGRRLRPPEMAMLATAGATWVEVRRKPRIAVLSTGDELVPADRVPGPGQVPDSNGPALCAALRRDGADPVMLGIAADRRGAVVEAVRRGLQCDALLCTGGSSVGERDYVGVALQEVLGVPPLFSGISIRPGRPTAAFVAGDRWAVALPGHAVSALVVYELLVREAVLRSGGETSPRPRGAAPATLAEAVRAPMDRDLLLRVRLEDGRAVPLQGASATVGNLARADGLVRCPAGHILEAGTRVAVALLD